MLFSSNVFIFVFLPAVLAFYYLIFKKNRKLQNAFLCISSLFFYAWGEPKFVLIMMLSIVLNWIAGLLVGNCKDKGKDKNAKIVVAIDVIFNLSLIFVFKYLMFVLNNINAILNSKIVVPEIALPIGISFFTFQAMSYVIDVYRGRGDRQKNIINVGLYISLFPQLIAGPIVRYETIADEIENRKETLEDFTAGIVRFIIGLGKKVLIANNVAIIADKAFEILNDGKFYGEGGLTITMAWMGILAYTLQIFFDFSGYSDMAIGLGKMFGFHFLENFNYPYISLSVTEFWRRWHISLGTWFRDYLYIPLGGNRTKTRARHIFNIFVVWLCTGIWHGANWTFIVWGLFYFVLLVLEKYTGFDVNDKNRKHHFIKHVYLIIAVMIGWVIFRSDSITGALKYISCMFSISGTVVGSAALYYLRQYWMFLLAGIIFSTPLIPYIKEKNHNKSNTIIKMVEIILISLIFLIAVAYLVKSSYNPFIYFNF